MDRKEKIQFFKSVLAGKSILESMPKIRVCFIERKPGKYFVNVDGTYKIICVNEAEAFTQKLKLENPLKILEINFMNHAEYLIIHERLQNEY